MEKNEDLNLDVSDTEEIINEKIKNSLGISISDIKNEVCLYMKDKSELLLNKIVNIIPYNDYGKILEEKSDILNFLKNECSSPETWDILGINSLKDKNLLTFEFNNSIVDEGNSLSAYVVIDAKGKIKHIFAEYLS